MYLSSRSLIQILLRRCAVAAGILLSLIFVVAASAQETPLKPDVRLVIDVSGSMKRNDPNNLRQPAVDLLVRLVPDGGKAGVWTFGKYVNMLVPHQPVNSVWREAASRKSAEINSVGLFTNIGGALETAAQDMASGNPGYATSVILLTDGMVDISKSLEENEAEWRRVVDQVFPALKKAGYKVHAVALSEEADRNLMEKLAITTGGTFAVAKTADDLMKIFLQAFDLAVPSQKVPLRDNRFLVDSSVNEFTALIFRKNPAKQTRLIGPDEEAIQADTKRDDVRWQRTDDYDLITVRKPYEGEWQIIAAIEPESRVTVVSNLALRVKDLPSNLFRGNTETLSFVLQGDGKPITDPNFLKLVENRISLSFGQTVESVVPGYWAATLPGNDANSAGLYSIELPALDKMGVYDLQLTVDGQTFVRTFAHRFTVREPFSASLELAPDEQGVMRHMLTVRSHSELIDPSQTQIVATLITPQRRRMVRPVEMVRPDQWQTSVPIEVPGEYQVTVQVAGTDTRKDSFDYPLTPLTYLHGADVVFPPAAVSEPEPEPEPEPKPEPVTPPPPPSEIPPAEPEPEEEGGLPSWLLYVALGLGNLAILAGGYWLFRRLTKDDSEAAAELSVADMPMDMAPPELAASAMSMDGMGMEDEQEPPMEDLTDDDPEPEDEIPALHDVVTDEDLREDLVEQVMGGESDEAKEDFAAEIRRVQGLDMDEDELDDAISNLIDELDGEPRPKTADLDDIDFPDEDKA
jgi:Periplasmic protein TonB, links inner and outer membranes